MAIASPLSGLGKISKKFSSIFSSLDETKKTTIDMKKVVFRKTKVKKESIQGDKKFYQRKNEFLRRKAKEDLIEAKDIITKPIKVIGNVARGFLERILDFMGALLLGWLTYNLPTILTMAREFIARVQRMVDLLKAFVGNILNIVTGFGNVLGSIYQNVISFDFFDTSNRVKNSLDDLGNNFDEMGKQFEEGMRLLTTPLNEGLVTGQDAAPIGTDYTTSSGSSGYASAGLSGVSQQRVGGDVEFLKEVKRVSQKYGIKEGDLLGLMASESGLNPKSNNGTHVGLIQFSADSAKLVGTSQSALLGMSRAQQMKYVDKYFEYWKLPKGANAGQLYATVFAPAYASKDPNKVLYSSPSREYSSNKPLDSNKDGKITISEMGGRIEGKKKEFGISDNISISETPTTSGGSSNAGIALAKSAEKLKQQRLNTSRYGRDGCVYAVNEIYRAAGMTPPWGSSVYVPTAREILVRKKFIQVGINGARPGDIVIMLDTHPTKPWVHIGVVSTKGTVIHNSSTNRALTNDESFSSLSRRYVKIEVFRDPNFAMQPAPKDSKSPSSLSPSQILPQQSLQASSPSAQASSPSAQASSPSAQALPPSAISAAPTQTSAAAQQLSTTKQGQQVVVVDDRKPPQMIPMGGGGGGGQPKVIYVGQTLNTFIKNKLLLDLVYT